MAVIVCYQLEGSGFTDLDPPGTYPVRLLDVQIDGPDGEGDTTVLVKYARVDDDG